MSRMSEVTQLQQIKARMEGKPGSTPRELTEPLLAEAGIWDREP